MALYPVDVTNHWTQLELHPSLGFLLATSTLELALVNERTDQVVMRLGQDDLEILDEALAQRGPSRQEIRHGMTRLCVAFGVGSRWDTELRVYEYAGENAWGSRALVSADALRRALPLRSCRSL